MAFQDHDKDAIAMDLLGPALQGAAAPALPPPRQPAPLLLIGGGGTLGSALLAELLARAGQGRVLALVEGKLNSALRSFVPLPRAQLGSALSTQTAVLVFERERRSNGRDEAFVQPQPDELLPLARALAAAGVCNLLVVVPHAPALLPGALRHGFASREEAELATLGFEQLLILRPSQSLAPDGQLRGLQRFAAWWLSQLRWMIPNQQQPVRVPQLAALVAELALRLPAAPPGHRVLPTELLWQAAQPGARPNLLADWLHGAAATRS